jgi:hypothetical protein
MVRRLVAENYVPALVSLSYLVSRNHLAGGEYYRATRPAALASAKWGWETSVCTQMATSVDDPLGPLSFIDIFGKVATPDIIVVRPIREWRQHWTDQAHANGQLVIADLDDNVWDHENYDALQAENPDNLEDWFWNVDAVLVSTKWLAAKVRQRHTAPVLLAPNCYDPFGLARESHPGRNIGTRLWTGARMQGDLVLYDQLFMPLLRELGLMWIHVGAVDEHRFVNRGWPESRIIERPSCNIPQLSTALGDLNIGAICISDHPFNDAKTETHAVELASMGVPLVAATTHPIYKDTPGRVDPTADAVRDRVRSLLFDDIWRAESERAVTWARAISVRSENKHMESLLQVVRLLVSA